MQMDCRLPADMQIFAHMDKTTNVKRYLSSTLLSSGLEVLVIARGVGLFLRFARTNRTHAKTYLEFFGHLKSMFSLEIH